VAGEGRGKKTVVELDGKMEKVTDQKKYEEG
jgi:hypothetical protein